MHTRISIAFTQSANLTYALGDGRTRLGVLAAIDTGDSEVGRRIHVCAEVLQEELQPVVVRIVSDATGDGELVRGARGRRGGDVVQLLQTGRGRPIRALGIGRTREDGLVDSALGEAGGLDSFGETAIVPFKKLISDGEEEWTYAVVG